MIDFGEFSEIVTSVMHGRSSMALVDSKTTNSAIKCIDFSCVPLHHTPHFDISIFSTCRHFDTDTE